jgi:sorbitol-specific phosphotransferase system component IIA
VPEDSYTVTGHSVPKYFADYCMIHEKIHSLGTVAKEGSKCKLSATVSCIMDLCSAGTAADA